MELGGIEAVIRAVAAEIGLGIVSKFGAAPNVIGRVHRDAAGARMDVRGASEGIFAARISVSSQHGESS